MRVPHYGSSNKFTITISLKVRRHGVHSIRTEPSMRDQGSILTNHSFRSKRQWKISSSEDWNLVSWPLVWKPPLVLRMGILFVFWWTSTHEKIFDLTNTNVNWSTYRLPTNNPFYLGSGYPFWISLITASICLVGSFDPLAASLINAWMCFGNLLNIRSKCEWVGFVASPLVLVIPSRVDRNV